MTRRKIVLALLIIACILLMISFMVSLVDTYQYMIVLRTRSHAVIECAGYPSDIATSCYQTEISPVER